MTKLNIIFKDGGLLSYNIDNILPKRNISFSLGSDSDATAITYRLGKVTELTFNENKITLVIKIDSDFDSIKEIRVNLTFDSIIERVRVTYDE